MKIHHKIIASAINAAKKSDVVRGKVGAVLFTDSGRILCIAHNKIVYGRMSKGQFTAHAEMVLLAKVTRIRAVDRLGLKNLNILVIRYKTETDGLANAKPCPVCEHYLKLSGIKYYYSNQNGEIETNKGKTLEHHSFHGLLNKR
jgi:tRNA(Arg) A34 adenosine deaminase TadA